MNSRRKQFAGRTGGNGIRKRVAVIGAGIVGLAHAWSAARRGHDVVVFERNPAACGASIRNFGMVWPIGQPNGPHHRIALRSRQLWLELLKETGFWHRTCGSLHVAFRDDEMAVLREFAGLASELGYDGRLLSPNELLQRSPAVRSENLLGGFWSPTELCVDPREIIAGMPRWLGERYGVEVLTGVPIHNVALPWITAAGGERWRVDRAIVATGAEFRTLFPQVFDRVGFRKCKLQMLRTVPQPDGWELGPMIASGLTLRHYETFRVCKSLGSLRERIANSTPELDRFGIHVMAAQNGRGEVILGDSHEYSDEITPFDQPEIDELILAELRKLIDLPDWTIGERWHGTYAVLPNTLQYVNEVEEGVNLVIATGGCGMTMSFGLAEDLWDRWEASGEMDANHAILNAVSTR
jgi:FAD dependent oxidoreductase TIGR03364